jgi:hypothetical protein
MKTVHSSLLAIAIILTALLSCNKSKLAPATTNSTATASSNASGNGTTTDCGDHDCVFTQGGYGAPNGGPHDFMYANFYKAFPNGFPVGSFGPNKCEDGHRVFMSSPEAVTANLPIGGKPDVLTKNYRDQSPNNVLVGQLITLCLNLGLDPYCPNYGTYTPLKDMIIASGTFEGMTVNEFFQLAGDVLGGCNTQYTPSEVNDAASSINENYEGGNQGFLVCPSY